MQTNSLKFEIIRMKLPYKWIYWRVEYLVICLKTSVGVILIWQN